jgi:hypothetical protein
MPRIATIADAATERLAGGRPGSASRVSSAARIAWSASSGGHSPPDDAGDVTQRRSEGYGVDGFWPAKLVGDGAGSGDQLGEVRGVPDRTFQREEPCTVSEETLPGSAEHAAWSSWVR